MNDALVTSPPAYVQLSKEAEEAHALLNRYREHHETGNLEMLFSGLYAIKLQDVDAHKALGYETFAALCAGELGVTYRTVRRRIRAARWHTDLGLSMAHLAGVEYSKLDRWFDVAVLDMYEPSEVLNDIKCLSDADMLEQYGNKPAPAPDPAEPEPQVVHIRVTCDCGRVIEQDVEV
jgi:predicted ribonuclease YlaK